MQLLLAKTEILNAVLPNGNLITILSSRSRNGSPKKELIGLQKIKIPNFKVVETALAVEQICGK